VEHGRALPAPGASFGSWKAIIIAQHDAPKDGVGALREINIRRAAGPKNGYGAVV
jgi:hypothetical protein